MKRESDLSRFAAIGRIAAAKGWGHYAERLGFGRHAEAAGETAGKSDAVRLREALEELGPTFVKLGQMMAGRTDIFPEELVAELGKLHEAAGSFSADVARRIVEEETGKPVGELYASFDDTPVAAASIAQVHFIPDLGVAQMAELYRFASTARQAARGTPEALARLIGRLERGEPLFDIRHQSGGSLERHLLHASNRLAFALIIAAIVVGSSIVIGAHAGPHLEGVPLLGIIGFVVAGALGVAWAVIALKSGKL